MLAVSLCPQSLPYFAAKFNLSVNDAARRLCGFLKSLGKFGFVTRVEQKGEMILGLCFLSRILRYAAIKLHCAVQFGVWEARSQVLVTAQQRGTHQLQERAGGIALLTAKVTDEKDDSRAVFKTFPSERSGRIWSQTAILDYFVTRGRRNYYPECLPLLSACCVCRRCSVLVFSVIWNYMQELLYLPVLC